MTFKAEGEGEKESVHAEGDSRAHAFARAAALDACVCAWIRTCEVSRVFALARQEIMNNDDG